MAKQLLLEAGASAVHINRPVHDPSTNFDAQFFRQMKDYRHQNDAMAQIRQLEALATCQAVLDKHTMLPEVVFRVRDDALVVQADMDAVLSNLGYQEEKMTVITGSCATRHGINNKIAALSGSAAKVYFTAPVTQYARTTLASWVKNMETYYLDTYMSNLLLMETTARLLTLTVRLEQRPLTTTLIHDLGGGSRGAAEDFSSCKRFVAYGTQNCEQVVLKRLKPDATPCAKARIDRFQEGGDGAVGQQRLTKADGHATTTVPPLKQRRKLAYVCISGQLARLELKSKIDNLIKPLQAHFEEVHVALSMTVDAPQGNADLVNLGVGLDGEQPSSPYTLHGASQRLLAVGVTKVHSAAPPPPSASRPAASSQYAAQLDEKLRAVAYRNRRAENDVRQFEALHNCVAGLKTLAPRVPDIAVRVRDDSYVVSVDVDALLEELGVRLSGGAQPAATLLTQRCASHGGLNDKFAAVSGAAAAVFFTAPLDTYYRRSLAPWVKNPETYYLDTYMPRAGSPQGGSPVQPGFQLMTSSSASVITTRLKRRHGCWKFVPAGDEACEKLLASKVLATEALPCVELQGEMKVTQGLFRK